MNKEEELEDMLASQIPEVTEENKVETTKEATSADQPNEEPKSDAAKYLNTQMHHKMGRDAWKTDERVQADKSLIEEKQLSKVGDYIGDKADIRDGWMEVDRELLGERSTFYPEDWMFRIRPATVDAIRNWSAIDDENPNSVDDVFNEILKSCLQIRNDQGLVPWGNINSWDRFYFLLLIREYTFKNGETKIEFEEDCPGCGNPVKYTLTSSQLTYDLPDPEVMSMYSQKDRTWDIDPEAYDLVGYDPITLYVPTLDKEANIKTWLLSRMRENPNRKIDTVFLRFLPWLAPKISKDDKIANRQIKQLELAYKAWDMDLFSFMDDVLKNIIVTPSSRLSTTCPICGEEVSAEIRFREDGKGSGIKELFNVENRHKKFGTK